MEQVDQELLCRLEWLFRSFLGLESGLRRVYYACDGRDEDVGWNGV